MAQRISPQEARKRMQSGGAMMVCAYDDAEKCRRFAIEGAVPYPDLMADLGSIPKSQELIFYCA